MDSGLWLDTVFTLTARLASVSRNSEAVSQAGGEAVMEAEGGSVLPHVTEIQTNKTFNQQFKIDLT